jgi:hypothetical protein
MAQEKSRLEKDLDRLIKRLQAGKTSLHDTGRKAENLDASIQTLIRSREEGKQNKKRSR